MELIVRTPGPLEDAAALERLPLLTMCCHTYHKIEVRPLQVDHAEIAAVCMANGSHAIRKKCSLRVDHIYQTFR